MLHPSTLCSRRTFLTGAGAGLAVGLPLGWAARRQGSVVLPPTPIGSPALGMPGRYPGRVIEVRDAESVDADNRINAQAVRRMVARGMCELTGADAPLDAWRSFFEKDDIVGIKVNPVGHNRRNPRAVPSISSPALLLEVVRNLRELGIRPRQIVVFERYANEFVDAGYDRVMTERLMDGVRWYASACGYSDRQVALDGVDGGRAGWPPELLRHVVGYDRDAFVHMGFASPAHDPKDDRSFRSHLSLIVSKMVNKVITLPVLKDHRSAGVTLALKNISHGMNNNVARSHVAGAVHGFPQSPAQGVNHPNQCNTFIPTAVNQPLVKHKMTLHILDGLIGVYEGGPGCWNATWATWRRQSLFFATDPVALDHVGWDIIDAKRLQEGWPRCGDVGRLTYPSQLNTTSYLAPLAGGWEALGMTAASRHLAAGSASELFELRTPEHVFLAGTVGLGVFDQRRIAYHQVQTGPIKNLIG